MENHSSQSSNSDENRNSLPPFLQSQPLPWSQEQGNDSSSGQFLSILQRRALVIAGVSITLMTVVVINLILNRELPIYEGNFRLLVEPVNDDSKVVDIVKDPNVTKSGLDYDSQIEVLKSPELMGEILKNLKTTYQDINYNSLMANFTISRLAQTKIIEVRYRSHNANQVKTVLDQIAEDYIEYSRERRQTKLRQGIQFVEKQLPSIQNRVDELQKELQTFRQKYDFFDPQIQSEQVVNRISSLSEERQVVNQQLAQARANLSVLQKKDGQVATLKDAALYQQLLAQLQELDVKIATESTRLQDSNPTIQTLKQQRSRLVPLLNQEARRFLSTKVSELTTQLKTLEVQSQELAKAEQKLERQRKQWPILARQYTELQRNLEVATESLNRFLSTRENLQIQISQTELGWQLLEAPSKPKFPISDSSLKRYLIPGIVGSIALGVGVAILLEKLDKTYHSSQTLKEEVKLPLLGNIPFEKQIESTQNYAPTWKIPILKSVSGLSIFRKKDQEDSSYSAKFLEALRVLYTNVQLVSGDRSITSLTITSAMEGDGKSTIAFHLAKVATEMGQRVLLVDANLRQPNIHNLSNLNNSRGLSNLILTNVAMNEAIRQLPSMNELSVITAGSIPPDPTKLLSSEEMKRLMMNFHHTFDLVIYDAPPVLELADVSLLAPHTDGILLVVRIDKTDSSMLQRTLEHLKTYRMNVLGMVSNGNKSNNRC
ncbi:capsular biosynthesis protein [Nostoc linckia z18]|uniref:non-specific protein-tyrosine kinase n=2 Tax=Nostoc linckia TaxID=92942 RepID=A0A9Q5ZE41_NOSLI|nr:polysaccharide biosynthesis tyrosine autokinase [Nostoc linckia]PHK39081.1 capsular biosynthesis protein [Nostoc linckia z15]PHK47858.1 capsular biosynthesis protein [Nostoc linckia z16]PHJ62733.1 capsular biosynthesis protein [Nostoc linckia z1]PHJ66561.1 capsular biosynthesis protein [Nostoc linckia z3]PHJ72683.1 capsular biosynthesis protein [Nostoc linckia z2]